MNNKTNFTTPNGNDFRFHGAQAAGTQNPNTESLDLFAEELPEQHDLAPANCVNTFFTAATVGGTASSFSTYSSFSG